MRLTYYGNFKCLWRAGAGRRKAPPCRPGRRCVISRFRIIRFGLKAGSKPGGETSIFLFYGKAPGKENPAGLGGLGLKRARAGRIIQGVPHEESFFDFGRRRGFGTESMRPHHLPFVMLGAGLLWFGWFGFNAGSELAADGTAGRAWVNTLLSAAAAMLAWMLVERIRDEHGTSLGAASGIVAGLVAITPAAGTVQTAGAIAIGAIAGVVCALAVGLKYKFGYDDSLDVVGVHLVGGLIGTILIGLFATDGINWSMYPEGALPGLFYGGGLRQLGTQVLAAIIAVVFAFAMTWVIATVLGKLMGWRVAEEEEINGIDLAQHGETAYESTGRSAIAHTSSYHLSTVADRLRAAQNAGTPDDVLHPKVFVEHIPAERVETVGAGTGVNNG